MRHCRGMGNNAKSCSEVGFEFSFELDRQLRCGITELIGILPSAILIPSYLGGIFRWLS